MARAGSVVSLSHNGTVRIDRGLVRPEDQEPESTVADRPKAAPGGMAAALVTDLSAHRTAALRSELAGNPAVALAAVVHALALPLVYGEHHGSCVHLRAVSERLDRHTKTPGDCLAHDALDRTGTAWRDRLPGGSADLLAYLAALTVNAVEVEHQPRPVDADDLACNLALDMRSHWRPSLDGFWNRLSKAGMVMAMAEAKVTASGPLDSVRKAEAAQMVATAMQGGGWLPDPLRDRLA